MKLIIPLSTLVVWSACAQELDKVTPLTNPADLIPTDLPIFPEPLPEEASELPLVTEAAPLPDIFAIDPIVESEIIEPETITPLDIIEPLEVPSEIIEPLEVSSDDLASDDITTLAPLLVTSNLSSSPQTFHPFPTEVLDETVLKRIAQGTLGDTLGWQPGVTSSSYGQGSSRPIIRGFDGYRVRILRDSIGTLDVSASSPDHGIALEPLLLREVEILRGPAALLYGNSALGGAVNSTTRSFATELPDRPLSGAFETRWDSAASSWTNTGYLDFTLGEFVITATGSIRDAGDYRIAGRARTSEYEELFNPVVNDPQSGMTVPIENPSGTLPNTHLNSESFSLGLSWLPEKTPIQISLAYSRFTSEYGLPFIFEGDPNDLFGDSSLDTSQDRLDFRFTYEPDLRWLEKATFHLGYGDYQHSENFEGQLKDLGTNFSDTLFDLQAWEARLDLIHQPTDWLRGLWGIQFTTQTLDPSFLARAPIETSRFDNHFESENLGLFIHETATLGNFKINAAFRWETQKIEDLSLEEFGFTREVNDTSISAILGGSWESENLNFLDRFKVNFNSSFIERIPTETERFAFWSNPGIQRFLIGGDIDGTPLNNEQALGLDLSFEADYQDLSLQLNLFHYQIDDYIFLQDLVGIGNQAAYTQIDARFYGLEAQLNWLIHQTDTEELSLTLTTDWLRANDRGANSPLPRIPPLRIGSRLEYQRGPLTTGLEIRHAFAQNRTQDPTATTQGELPTDSFTEINLDLNYDHELQNGNTLTYFANFRNLLDEDRRHATSFLKDVAPLPGRSLTLGARFEF